MSKILFFFTVIILLGFNFSCDSSGELVGSWHLQDITTVCSPDAVAQQYEAKSTDMQGCQRLITTMVEDSIVLSSEKLVCLTLIFEKDGSIVQLSDGSAGMDTKVLSYVENEQGQIEVCDEGNNCILYVLEKDQLVFNIELTTIQGVNCERSYIFTK